jgi:PPK2 family polyphosphate:nucleotide phosphotransferase
MAGKHHFHLDRFVVPFGRKLRLAEHDPAYTGGIRNKGAAQAALLDDVSHLAAAQELLWATGEHALLIILQGLDAAGKDGTIKHVMSGVNPQGCNVTSFKAPSDEEAQHDFLWRPVRFLPARGQIAIFNRSYYEEVLVVRVHPEFLERQHLPPEQRRLKPAQLWALRHEQIVAFERRLVENGTCVLKFFLHTSREEQRRRFLARLSDPKKCWKFSAADSRERKFWDDYIQAYEDMLSATSTRWAPWYVIPADHKWFLRACVADIIAARLTALRLKYPKVSKARRAELARVRRALEGEKTPEACE